jgi:hypothetical protein
MISEHDLTGVLAEQLKNYITKRNVVALMEL